MTDDTDAKEWKTIKIPETVRIPAKADSRTYGEIMQSGLVFDVDERTRDRFEELRQETDAEDAPIMGPGLFLSALLDTWEAVGEGFYDEGADSDPTEIPPEIRDQLQRIESAATSAESKTNTIERKVDELEAR